MTLTTAAAAAAAATATVACPSFHRHHTRATPVSGHTSTLARWHTAGHAGTPHHRLGLRCHSSLDGTTHGAAAWSEGPDTRLPAVCLAAFFMGVPFPLRLLLRAAGKASR